MAKKTRINQFIDKMIPMRSWVQSVFLLVWLDPLGLRFHSVCAPVFHCYSCPLATFACPVGVLANFAALHLFPFVAVGILIAAGVFLGTVICGWICPFGFFQDLAASVPTPKYDLPSWTSYGRYVVLFVSVLAVPYFLGAEHWLFICRYCPAGALEGAIPSIISDAASGNSIVIPNTLKITVTVLVVGAMFVKRRPWCRVLCPLGAIFSIFNRFSVFSLKVNPKTCNNCKSCHSLCKYGLEPDTDADNSRCVRCLECTQCKKDAVTVDYLFDNSKPLKNLNSTENSDKGSNS